MALDPRMKDYLDWAVRGLVVALLTAMMATARWAINTEQRLHDLEQLNARIVVLESKEDSYQQLRTDIAVIRTQLDNQDKKYDHIEELLSSLSRR